MFIYPVSFSVTVIRFFSGLNVLMNMYEMLKLQQFIGIYTLLGFLYFIYFDDLFFKGARSCMLVQVAVQLLYTS